MCEARSGSLKWEEKGADPCPSCGPAPLTLPGKCGNAAAPGRAQHPQGPACFCYSAPPTVLAAAPSARGEKGQTQDTLQTHPLLPGQVLGRWLHLVCGCLIPSLSGLLLYKMVLRGEVGCAGVIPVAWRRKLWHHISFQENSDFDPTITSFFLPKDIMKNSENYSK